DVPPLGQLEAFSTGGGCDTCPQTYASRLTHFDFKTLRYPGHHQALSLLTHLGFLSRDPVTIKGQAVVPLHVFQAVMGRLWNRPEVADIYVLRVEVDGTHHGRPAHYAATLVERSDKADTGFTAIQRCTGFGAGAMMSALVAGRAMPGAWPPERVVEPAVVLDGLRDRGLNIVEKQRVDAPEHQNSSHRSSS
ncbi:MAG: saccharopine dehydrogenase C-terminal domain-containing protein, partial [Myxococcota bacterium]